MIDLRRYKNVLLDLDNTIYEQWTYDREIFINFFSINGYNKKQSKKLGFELALKKSTDSIGYNCTFDDFFLDKKIKLAVKKLLNFYYYPPLVKLELPKFSYDLLNSSKNKNLILISNGNLRVQYNKILSLNIGHFFNQICILTPHEGPALKPSNEVLSSIYLKNGDSVYVGDNLSVDKPFAKNCGFDFIHLNISNQNDFFSK